MRKKIYGKYLFFPMDETVRVICEAFGKKTINDKQLNHFRKEGWAIEIIQEE
jgi:hypothetical protein